MEKLIKITEKFKGKNTLLNVSEISTVKTEINGDTVIYLKNGKFITVKESFEEIESQTH